MDNNRDSNANKEVILSAYTFNQKYFKYHDFFSYHDIITSENINYRNF